MLTGEDKKFYQLSKKFNSVNTLLVSTKGFTKDDLSKLEKIKIELSSHAKISINIQQNKKRFQDYKRKYQMYLNNLSYMNSRDSYIAI